MTHVIAPVLDMFCTLGASGAGCVHTHIRWGFAIESIGSISLNASTIENSSHSAAAIAKWFSWMKLPNV